MNIIYKYDLEIDNKKLYNLFLSANWIKDMDDFKLNNFNMPFKNSTVVISAWYSDNLIGCVRVISDKVVRSIIEDLVVLPDYQNKGIGRELVRRCIECYPKSEWIVNTTNDKIEFYKKCGFAVNDTPFLIINSKWF